MTIKIRSCVFKRTTFFIYNICSDFILFVLMCICSAQSENRYNSGIVLRKVGILTLSNDVINVNSGIAHAQSGIGTK